MTSPAGRQRNPSFDVAGLSRQCVVIVDVYRLVRMFNEDYGHNSACSSRSSACRRNLSSPKQTPSSSPTSSRNHEYHLNINGDDFYIDLLFYNLKLHSYIVIELKAEKFKPEHLGQLNFYVTAVNRELKTDRDNVTIGLLICKDKNDVVCEYSLEQISQPIGISKYEITKLLEAEYKSSLPSIEEIEKKIKEIDTDN